MNSSLKLLAFVVLELAILYFTRYAYFAGLVILPAVIFYTVSLTAKNIFVRLENPAPAEEENTESESEEEPEEDETAESELDAADKNEGDEPSE